MKLTIRRMRETDLDDVYFIENSVHITPWSRDVIRDCILIGYDCRVLVISNDGTPTIAGYVISRHSNYLSHILNLCIAKPLQSKGYGRKLLQEVLYSYSTSTKINAAVLEVRPSNTVAVSLYKSMGFQEVEIKKSYYKDKATCEDAIFLEKILR